MQFSGLSVAQVDTPAVKNAFVSAVVASVDATNVTVEITAISGADSRRTGGTIVQYSVAAPAASMSALDMTNANNSGSFISSFQQQLAASNDPSAQSLASVDLGVQQIYPTAAPTTPAPTTPAPTNIGDTTAPTTAPTFNVDASLRQLKMYYTSTAESVVFHQTDSTIEPFASTW
jgi:hypothetical protein